jgi:hypothetical protein
VCVPVVGSSAFGLLELAFRLDRLLGPIFEFPVSLVYPVDVVFEPVGFVSPLLIHAFELELLEQLVGVGLATLQRGHVIRLV